MRVGSQINHFSVVEASPFKRSRLANFGRLVFKGTTSSVCVGVVRRHLVDGAPCLRPNFAWSKWLN